MHLIVMGTGGFAVPTFEALIESGHTVSTLVTRPPRPAHGRRTAPPNPMSDGARRAGIPVEQPDSINSGEAHELLGALQADLFVVCDYGQILSADTLRLSRCGGINLHASLLPKYRGAAPINWAIYHGETETGVTVIHMTPELDAGPCLVQRRVSIDSDETAVQLEVRLAELGVEPVMEAIRLIANGETNTSGIPQDPTLATKAPRLKKADGQVDWTRSAQQIRNQVRAMKPWPRTYTELTQQGSAPLRVILEQVSVLDNVPISGTPGSVIANGPKPLIVATGYSALSLDEIQVAGKRVMSAEEFLRGRRVSADARFGLDE